jgi:hypothetical protein
MSAAVPYRENAAVFVERCVCCDAIAATRCARCGDPGCDWHLFSDERVCAGCEDAWQPEARDDGRIVFVIVYAIACVIAVLTRMPFVGGLGLGTGAALLYLVHRHRRDQDRRRAFLSERRTRPSRPIP